MIWQQTPHLTLLGVTLVVFTIISLHMLRRFHGVEATAGMLLILVTIEWMAASVLQLGAANLNAKLFWEKMKFLSIALSPLAWFFFISSITGHEKWMNRRTITLMGIIPVTTLFLVFTNEFHELIWTATAIDTVGPFSVLQHTYGVGFWISFAYSCVLVFLSSFLLIQMLIRYRNLFRWQSGVILFSALIPPLWSVLYLFGFRVLPIFEQTPMTFPFVNLTLVYGLLYIKTVDIMPVARGIVIDGMGDSVIVVDAKNRIIDANPSAQRLMGRSHLEFLGHPLEEVWPDWRDLVEHPSKSEEGKEIVVSQKDEQRTYDLRVSALAGWRGDLMGRVIVVRDTTERKEAEEKLREREEKYRLLAENATDVIWTMDMNLRFTYMSPSVEQLRGYTAEEVMAQSLDEVLTPSSVETALKTFEEGLAIETREQKDSPRTRTLELEHLCKDGSTVWVEITLTGLRDVEGNLVGMLGVSRDITERKKAEEERKRAEEKVKQSLQEKEVLLREIHHRVKNNLQIISSLLSLQSRYIKDKRDLEMLKESQNRIKSMALIHEKLYQSENLADIDSHDYITDLMHGLFRSYATENITLTVDVEDVPLKIDAAIPCGLIINELVSNSLKHAFPGNRRGEIKVLLRAVDGAYELVVADNGIGIPDNIDFRSTESLGLRLVTILAESQLDGEIRLVRSGGTEFCITFKEQ